MLRLGRCLPLLLLPVLLSLPRRAFAQATVPVLLLSDIHFDPFQDPAKVPQLRTEPVERWPAILSAPPSPTKAADLQTLQADCGARALDTPWPLLRNALAAAHAARPRPAVITLSGDLLTHDFPCRFEHTSRAAVAPQDPLALSAFATKTIAFVLLQLRSAFPNTPVYSALGNNDSGCADYRETPDDAFLRSTTPLLSGNIAPFRATFSPEGDYTVTLPAPFHHARLIVLQDIFEARQFSPCAGNPARSATTTQPEADQIAWLRAQLADARSHGEHAWVMAHIPPGVDVYTSYRRYLLQPAAMCAAPPRPFLADTALADTLLDNADVVTLALFGHTHMDELRLLRRPADNPTATANPTTAATANTPATVPAKLVPSISPVFGNHPAFLLAAVDARSLVLRDWQSFVSPDPAGSAAPWTEAYRFSSAYRLPDLAAASVAALADGFTTDPTGQSPRSIAFREHFYAGDMGLYALGLAQIWPAYACAIREYRPSAVQRCLCTLTPTPAPAIPAP